MKDSRGNAWRRLLAMLLALGLASGVGVAEEERYTPSYTSPWADQDTTENYWNTPMDIRDEAAVWKALTAPVTVLAA